MSNESKRGPKFHGKKPKKKIHVSVDDDVYTIASAGNMSKFFNEAGKYYLSSGEFRRKMSDG